MPPADYVIKLYAVGGDPAEGIFSISSDFNEDQILVPGVGCPPYPLVRVTDTTGFNSIPVVLDVEQIAVRPGTVVSYDENGNEVSSVIAKLWADAFDPDDDPIVRYTWTVYTEVRTSLNPAIPPKEEILHATGAADTHIFEFPDFGYYFVDVEVEDNRCGRSNRQFIVKIHPPCVSPAPNSGPNFTYPTPKPNSLHYVTDLPGGMDLFQNKVAARFTVFVVDEPPAAGPVNPCHIEAQTNSVQFALFPAPGFLHVGRWVLGDNVAPLTLTSGEPAIFQGCLTQFDLDTKTECCIVEFSEVGGLLTGVDRDGNNCTIVDDTGARFWMVEIPDMNLLPPNDGQGHSGRSGVEDVQQEGH